jgi:hypothetical protein
LPNFIVGPRFEIAAGYLMPNRLEISVDDGSGRICPETFIKIGTYLPYPVPVCLNGNQWLKQQLHKEAIPSTAWTAVCCGVLTPNACKRWQTRSTQPTSRRSSIAG